MEELQKYLVEVKKTGVYAIEATKEVVDEESDKLLANIQKNTPVRTGALRDSLKKTKVDSIRGRYGYTVDYDGYNAAGQAYSKIGRTLNKGTVNIKPVKQIDKAVRKLKGMDIKIEARFLNKVQRGVK